MGFHPTPSDPFYELMMPPLNETPAQKEARMKRELDAQRVNDSIDEAIKLERAVQRRNRKVIKVLLLGQSESGKSTTLKNFRLRFARTEWEKERNAWRSVIQLNVVRSINTILRVVESEMSGDVPIDSDEDDDKTSNGDDIESIKFTDRHQLLIIRLAPLRGVEADLQHRLGAGSEPVQPALGPLSATPFDDLDTKNTNTRRKTEFSVRSWKDVLSPQSRDWQPTETLNNVIDDITQTIADCRDDMKALWDDKTVRLALKRREMMTPETEGFFLNDLGRIASRDYVVTDDDVMRARLRTVGIQEHRLLFKQGPWDNPGRDSGWEWRIFDVGGCRTTRTAWLPFFDNVNVIIFLSPISVFDQRLEEDPNVNRLEDSIVLWTSICSTKLLARTQLILFLNKCDLLRRKLKRGVKVNQFLPSFGDRPNEILPVIKYFREKFKDILRNNSPEQRQAYIYPTTVTDTLATAKILESVRDGVLRENLAASQLI